MCGLILLLYADLKLLVKAVRDLQIATCLCGLQLLVYAALATSKGSSRPADRFVKFVTHVSQCPVAGSVKGLMIYILSNRRACLLSLSLYGMLYPKAELTNAQVPQQLAAAAPAAPGY